MMLNNMERKKKITIGLIISVCLVLLLGGMYLYSNRESDNDGNNGNKEQGVTVISDAEKFSEEYPEVPKENAFVYRDLEQIEKILKNGTGIVYLGFPECPWCQRYVTYLHDVATEKGIEKIYYFNVLQDRKDNTEGYQRIVELLGENLDFDDEGNHRIYVPDVTFVYEGEIVAHDNETSMSSGDIDEYWTEKKVESLKDRLRKYIDGMLTGSCESCE